MNVLSKDTLKRLLTVLFIATSVLMMTGCISSITVTPLVTQQNLLVKCPETLPLVQGKTGEDWILMAQQWSAQYRECAIPHNGLVDAVNQHNETSKE